jgi:hypothetical protein
MTVISSNLARAIACNENIGHLDEEIASVATEWFANWLRARAEMELSEGNEEGATVLNKTAYALVTAE